MKGGSLPSWMEVIDAELEAIYQYLREKEDGERVLMFVDCLPALFFIKKALQGHSMKLEGKAREMVLRLIKLEVERLELVVFYWVPSHVGIIPQSYVDQLCKQNVINFPYYFSLIFGPKNSRNQSKFNKMLIHEHNT